LARPPPAKTGWAAQEAQIEQAVSRHILAMPFLWLAVSGGVDRGNIERNSIAVISHFGQGLGQPSVEMCRAREVKG